MIPIWEAKKPGKIQCFNGEMSVRTPMQLAGEGSRKFISQFYRQNLPVLEVYVGKAEADGLSFKQLERLPMRWEMMLNVNL